MGQYFDTSALCRYYHPEPGSAEVDRIVNEYGSAHVLSWLTVLEVQSAFALKVRTREIDAAQFLLLCKRLKADIAGRRFVVVRMLRRHFTGAANLLSRYGSVYRLRSLDALHLAVAIDLLKQGRIDRLLTADKVLATLAPLEGLPLFNPLAP